MDRLSIRQSLLFFALVLVLILGSTIGTLTYTRAGAIVSESQRGVIADTINRIDINLNTKVRYINQTIRDSSLLADSLTDGWNGEDTRQLCGDIQRMLEEVGLPASVYLLSSDGQELSVQEGELVLPPDRMLEDVSRDPQKIFWTTASDSFARQGKSLRVYRGILSAEGELAGILAVEFQPAIFNNLLLANENILRYQYTFLLDGEDALICSDKYIDEGLKGEIAAAYRSGRQKFFFSWNGREYYACGRYNGLTGWRTFSAIAVDDLFPEAHTLRNYIFLVVAVAMTLMLLFILILYRSITRPLKRLADAMKTAQGGNFAVRLPPGQEDEIGYLSHTFNEMVDRIDQLVNEVYRSELAQKTAEMEALQAQINPHFLYNTLDAINWMLIERDAWDISDIVVALGSLMQYTMDTSTATVPLHLEYAYIEDYLRMQKCRLTHRLEYRLLLDESLRELEVPKLILQPLVENAIQHGVEPRSGGGRVEICSRQEGNRALLSIRDNGPGMSEGQLRQLMDPEIPLSGSTGIGVHNVRRRLKLYFGGRCRFEICSAPEQGTEILITIDLIADRKEGGGHANSDH